eukprot:TRINITY_DN2406_c0_g2_i1.p1 TRINITY_DN2406_c0_g2~~TRINITY_DN2406_c0_g2_i1.p1  ORF type:complete len:437 (-),score=55.75 TRINITY_DN2406_c0_g2_i1:652-1962(-)
MLALNRRVQDSGGGMPENSRSNLGFSPCTWGPGIQSAETPGPRGPSQRFQGANREAHTIFNPSALQDEAKHPHSAGLIPPVANPARLFHVLHKVPKKEGPYAQAKRAQLVEKNLDLAIASFMMAIIVGDREASALKDMASVMRQQNRSEEAIGRMKSLRSLCEDSEQESIDNVLLDLYKRCGMLPEQMELLHKKLRDIDAGIAFNGKPTKRARLQGKTFEVSIKEEKARLLGNLGWVYMKSHDFIAAERAYQRAFFIRKDNNKIYNLSICRIAQARLQEAKETLEMVNPAWDLRFGPESYAKTYQRANVILALIEDCEQFALWNTAAGAEYASSSAVRFVDIIDNGVEQHYSFSEEASPSPRPDERKRSTFCEEDSPSPRQQGHERLTPRTQTPDISSTIQSLLADCVRIPCVDAAYAGAAARRPSFLLPPTRSFL